MARRDGQAGWGIASGAFSRQLEEQASETVIAPEVDAIARRGRDHIRVTVTMIISAADPAQAASVAWLVLRKASGGRLSDWDGTSAALEVRGERPG